MANVLIIDDDKSMSLMLVDLVNSISHKASCSHTLKDGLKLAKGGDFDVIFLDVKMPDGNGLDLLAQLRKLENAPEVIIITGAGDPDGAEIAIKNGAWDYLQKPLSPKKIILPLKRVLQYRDNINKFRKPFPNFDRQNIIGNSQQLENRIKELAYAAHSKANVLITGETGTGKEVFARTLHYNCLFFKKRFIAVDCASLTENLVENALFGHKKGAYTGAFDNNEGLIKMADGGTLFLDEIGEMSLSIQKTFLRVLQEKRFRPVGGKTEIDSSFRMVAATNRDLEKLVNEGLFRKDLLYRLRSVMIELPPLRQRLEDIRELAIYFIKESCQKNKIPQKGFVPEFIDLLMTYDWPGNVREFANTIDSAVSNALHEPILFRKHLPDHIRIEMVRSVLYPSSNDSGPVVDSTPEPTSDRPLSYKAYRESVLDNADKKYLENLIKYTKNNIEEACEISKLGRTRLYALLKKSNLKRSDF